ncbi:MAG: type II secretion system protein [Planctomycetota bacterium]
MDRPIVPAMPNATPTPRSEQARGFTLIELLVVISIIALLIGILLPALGRARQSARAMQCLSNIRQMQIAHTAYLVDNDGQLIQANLAHGGISHGSFDPWFVTLAEDYGTDVSSRSPLDDSPHWGPAPTGEPIPGAPATQRRVTSYGINNFLDRTTNPWGPGYDTTWQGYHWDQVERPSAVVHFLIMAYTGDYAGADHPHVESWLEHPDPAYKASTQVQINAVSGAAASDSAVSNWGYLDGHAEAQAFGELVTDIDNNNFDPWKAR